VKTDDPANVGEMVSFAEKVARVKGYAEDGDGVIICAGVPFGRPGTTNMLRIHRLGEGSTPAD
jgi:pyruvate kinase